MLRRTPQSSSQKTRGLDLARAPRHAWGIAPRRSFSGCVIAAAALAAVMLLPGKCEARRHDSVADLQAKIERETNPIKRAKLQVRLGRLEMSQAAEAYDHRRIQSGEALLSQSTASMESAWSLLKSTGRNPARKPDGFMQLEIGLREEARSLTQLRRRVFYLNRGPLDAALKALNALHAQVLLGLFPGAAPPGGSAAPKAKMPAYQNSSKGPPQ